MITSLYGLSVLPNVLSIIYSELKYTLVISIESCMQCINKAINDSNYNQVATCALVC